MIHRAFVSISFTSALLCAFCVGCGKSDSSTAGGSPQSQSAIGNRQSAILTLHWLGKKKLATEANATNFMAIWNLPESAKLEAQTLDKLATAPWRLWATNVPLSNAPSAQLRPLLDDLVQEEFYLEVRGDTNQASELVLAIHLPSGRAALWQTNLPTVLMSLFPNFQLPTSNSPASGPDFRLQASDFRLDIDRSGDWTLLSVAFPSTNAASPATLLTAVRDQIAATKAPFPPRATNYWVEIQSDLAWLGRRGWGGALRTNLPTLAVNVIGENGNVRTIGEIVFPGAAPIEMEPWNIPTSLVHDPLIGFMAVRGFRPLLQALSWWDESRFGVTPNQVFHWEQDGQPPLRFFAFPSADATNQIVKLTEYLLNEINPLMARGIGNYDIPIGAFEPVPNSLRVRWRGLPLVSPNIDLAGFNGRFFITGGVFQNRVTNRPVPMDLVQQFRQDSNLLAYDWEMTQASEYRLIQIGQLTRFVFGRARLSMTNNPSLPWLVAISSKLGVSGTSIRLVDSSRIALLRSSTIGLTAEDIHILVEWLESPSFPAGFFSAGTPARMQTPPTRP